MPVIKPYSPISKVELETIATKMRSQVEKNRRRRLNADSIAEGIADSLELNIEWEYISADNTGKIAAMIFPTKKLIVINTNTSQLENNGFMQSTIAHEIGHWVLHINQTEVEEYIDRYDNSIETENQPKPFLCRKTETSQTLADREWQAQYFAGCLLMPYHKLMEARQGRDLTNWSHLYAMKDDFGVTISNLTFRLKDLGWIEVNNNSTIIYPGKNLLY